MINNPELIKQVIDNIKKLSKEDLDKVMKEADEWYNKEVTDTNVGSIEKDIKRCKELIKDKHKEWIGMTNQKAIENVLNDYERLQNGKQELIEYYENKIQELEKENQELLEVKISVSAENTIQNLKRENIKLEERCFIAEGNLKTTKEELRDYFYNSIPKQKIKDKIEELKYRADGIAGTYQYADSQEHLQEKKKIVIELRTKVEALEELLKEVNK